MLGTFSCPSGANVSWSRAPPPKVMTTTFFFLGKAAAAANGDRKRVLPKVTPAASRRNSRRVRPTPCAISSKGFMDCFPGCRLVLLSPNKRTAEFLIVAFRALPGVARAAADKFPAPAGHLLSFRCARMPVPGGSAHREDPHSGPAPAHTAARRDHISSDPSTGYPAASKLRETWNRAQYCSSRAIRSAENWRRRLARAVLSTNSSHSNKEDRKSAARVRRSGGSVESRRLLVRENCRRPWRESSSSGDLKDSCPPP